MALTAKQKRKFEIAIGDKGTALALEASLALTRAGTVAPVSMPDATDLPSAEALANTNKATINLILVALKAAGLMA